jgi:hypothetical protein
MATVAGVEGVSGVAAQQPAGPSWRSRPPEGIDMNPCGQ